MTQTQRTVQQVNEVNWRYTPDEIGALWDYGAAQAQEQQRKAEQASADQKAMEASWAADVAWKFYDKALSEYGASAKVTQWAEKNAQQLQVAYKSAVKASNDLRYA